MPASIRVAQSGGELDSALDDGPGDPAEVEVAVGAGGAVGLPDVGVALVQPLSAIVSAAAASAARRAGPLAVPPRIVLRG